MRSTTRIVAFALGAIIVMSACTADEITIYLDTTRETRNVLTNAQLARLRDCESTDNYQAVSRSGLYRGAYQFDQTTWDDVAGRHFPWLIGHDPITVWPWWQDAMTRALWSERGKQPWPVCGHRV